jgi:succinyl-diaminopimelate desuccinylase
MEILKKANIPFNGKLQIWLTPDEETHGTFGSLFMAKNHRAVIESDLSIIAEATAASPLQSPAIAIGEKGPLWLKLTFFGAAGHGSMPKAKSNAINKAVRFMANLKKYKLPKSPPPIGIIPLFKHLLGRYSIGDLLKVMKVAKTERNPYDEDGNSISALTHSTHSFGLFQSGSKVNVIPDEAELEVDFRLLPGIQLTEVMKNLQKYSANLGYHMKLPAEYSTEGTLAEKIKNRPVDIQVEILTWGEGSIEDMETSHYSIVKETFESAYHVHAVPAFSSGFTDAGNLRQAGLKNIFVVGPRGRNFHAENESVDIDSLISVTKFYLLLAYRFLTRSK